MAKRRARKSGKTRAKPIAAKRIAEHRPAHRDAAPPRSDPRAVIASRELFWQNVIREMLTNLSMLCSVHEAGTAARARAAAPPEGDKGGATPAGATAPKPLTKEEQEQNDLFDGRLAVVTREGQRVPISSVFPLFACAIDTSSPDERTLAMAVECTVFQVRTPGGEVYTLPLSEIRSFHALTPGLMNQLEQAAERARPLGEEAALPFGFAAFTSLVRGGPSIVPAAPDNPTE